MAYKAPIWEDGKSPAISAENLNNLSQAAEGAQVLYGNSAPTSSTEGAVGQFYLVVVADSDGNYPLYQCVAIANGSYTWRDTRRIPDSITSMLGIPAPGTINRALNVLANVGNLHVWERVQTYAEPVPEVPAGYTLGETLNKVVLYINYNSDDVSRSITCYESLTVAKDGTISGANSSSHTIYYSGSNSTLPSSIGGKFLYENSGSTAHTNAKYTDQWWYIPTDVEILTGTGDTSDGESSTRWMGYSKLQRVTGYPYTPAIPAGTTTDYLTSTDRNAYPDKSAEGGEPEKPAYYTLGNEQTNELIQTSGGSATLYFNVASSVSVADNGTVSLISPSQITLSASGSTMNLADYKTKCAGKFIVAKDQTYSNLKLFGIWYVGEDCEFTDVADSSAGTKTLSCSNMQLVTGHAKVEEIPANATITYLGQLGEPGAKIEVGSYVGTGIESADILIGFTPKAVLVSRFASFYDPNGDNSAFILPGIPNKENVKRAEIIDGGFRVYYYSNSSASRSSYLNNSGETYRYIAIG